MSLCICLVLVLFPQTYVVGSQKFDEFLGLVSWSSVANFILM